MGKGDLVQGFKYLLKGVGPCNFQALTTHFLLSYRSFY
jgi:hypothetical protein